jgi:hypothetical protein
LLNRIKRGSRGIGSLEHTLQILDASRSYFHQEQQATDEQRFIKKFQLVGIIYIVPIDIWVCNKSSLINNVSSITTVSNLNITSSTATLHVYDRRHACCKSCSAIYITAADLQVHPDSITQFQTPIPRHPNNIIAIIHLISIPWLIWY